jgi:hypothetical protein
MTFPQFITGATGRLTFSTLNETFDRIEKLERSESVYRNRASEKTEIFPAKILSVSGSLGAFVEVAPSATQPNSWTEIPNGIRSTDGTNVYATPIVGSNLAVDRVVFLHASNAPDGSEIYLVVEGQSVSNTFAAIITASTALTGSAATRKAWKYTLKRFAATETTTNITYTGTGPDLFAYNGCENNTDSTTVFGVGLKPDVTPAAPTLVRQPIKTGTVVLCVTESSGLNFFSVPNGYEVTCP